MNALKHAFPAAKPDAAIAVSYRVAETDWKLTISDNGVGKPDVKASESKGGRHRSVPDSRNVQSQTTSGG
jgi:chemotaxis protein methyltransferase CheR